MRSESGQRVMPVFTTQLLLRREYWPCCLGNLVVASLVQLQ
jgi:hypothetical protein